jgi:hypothetical protein
MLHQARHPNFYVRHFVYDGGVIKSPGDCVNSPRVWPNLNERSDVAKATPAVPCSADNCGDLFPKCGKSNTYKKLRCRCAACRAAAVASNRKYLDPEADREYKRKHYEANRADYIERAHRNRQENLEYCRRRQREYQKANAEQLRTYYDQYRQENAETLRQKKKQHYQNNVEVMRERSRRWAAANRDIRRAHDHVRRARKKKAFVEYVDRKVVFERDNYICQRCGRKCDPDAVWPAANFPTLDHIIPYAAGVEAGGVHSYANTQCLCLPCNSSKGPRK